MKRLLLDKLLEWKSYNKRKPLIVKGARQVGKSYLIRQFGKKYFKYFIELNFERNPEYSNIFSHELSPDSIIKKIKAITDTPVKNGDTLIFFDEIQNCPNAIISLRYFYEEMPDLHIVSAGSLIDFALDKIGIPVGRVEFLYLYPMNFEEFLIAKGKESLLEIVLNHKGFDRLDEFYHKNLISLLGEYISVGGMPEALKTWIANEDIQLIKKIYGQLIETYKQDFVKYAKQHQTEYVEKVFNLVPLFLGEKIIYSKFESSVKIRKIRKAFELLQKAFIIHPVYHTSANGIPLGAEKNPSKFKAIIFDIGIAQNISDSNIGNWLINPEYEIINKGQIIENFVGQELISYSSPDKAPELYYWMREKRNAQAEVDYIVSIDNKIIPIEVKNKKHRGKSINIFLKEKKKADLGIIFSNQNFHHKNSLKIMPLYSIVKLYKNNLESLNTKL